MRQIRLLCVMLACGLLPACDMDASSEAPDINVTVNYPDNGDDGGGDDGGDESTIVNTPLPVYETFDASDAQGFFSAAYRSLASDFEGDEDSFYYSMAGVYNADGTVDTGGGNWITADADPAMRLGNGRYTIAQTVSPLVEDQPDPRKDSTAGSFEESWGEFDLTQPYTISFCVVAVPESASSSDFQIYVDNNTTGESNSIHGGGNDGSRIFNYPVNSLVPGQRVEINVPGNTTLQSGGDVVAVKSLQIGTEHSFFSVRVSSGGYAVYDDFVVEYQDAPYDGAIPDCSAKTTAYATEHPLYGDGGDGGEEITGTPFTGLPLNVNLAVDADTFFGTDEATESFLSLSNDPTAPFYTAKSGASRTFIENSELTFGNARFYMGFVSGSTAGGGSAVGDIDLSAPYRISFEVVRANSAGNFIVYVDNTESGISDGANSPHGMDAVLYQTSLDQLGAGQIVTIESEVGSDASFLQFRCDSGCGDPTADNLDLGVTIRNIVIEYQGGAPEPDPALVDEDFGAADADTFFSAAYKSLPNDVNAPLYVVTAGSPTVADGTLSMANARFTVGAVDPAGNPTAEGVDPVGALDLSQPYRISFQVLAFDNNPSNGEGDVGKFQVYLDNNTTSSGNSIHGGSSKVVEMAVSDVSSLPITVEFTDEDLAGTATSFIQIRADSRVGALTIDDLKIEYR